KVIPLVKPAGGAEVLAIPPGRNGPKGAAVAFQDVGVFLAGLEHRPGSNVGADVIDDPMGHRQLQAEHQDFRVLQGVVEADGEAEARSLFIFGDQDDMPTICSDIGNELSVGCVHDTPPKPWPELVAKNLIQSYATEFRSGWGNAPLPVRACRRAPA